MAALMLSPCAMTGRVTPSQRQAASSVRGFQRAACRPLKARSLRVLAQSQPAGGQPAQAVAAGAVTEATFDELVLRSPVPVLLDFWAPWCGPCRMIAPLVDELAKEYGSKLRVLKINTDESPSIATAYGIRSIPTVMVFKDGQKVDAVIGAVPKATLVNVIDRYLGESK